jgi:CelD/BcsL family acetyltransferase involved in cellulose biosynthesis
LKRQVGEDAPREFGAANDGPTCMSPADLHSPSAKSYWCAVVDADDALDGLRDAWNALYADVPAAYLSDGFDWARLSWEIVGRPRGRTLLCMAVHEDSQLIAVLPLVTSQHGRLRIAKALNSEAADYCPFLVHPDADLGAVWGAIREELRRRGDVDVLELALVRDDGPLGRCLAGEPRALKTATIQSSQICSAGYAEWDSYLAAQSRGLPADVRRDRRLLAAKGEVQFEDVTDPADRAVAWSWMLSKKREALLRRGERNSWFFSEEYPRFVAATLEHFRTSGGRRIFALKLDGAIIAADLCNVNRARVEGFVTTYDEAYAKASPGKLLRYEAARWAFERGLVYDLRIGGDAHKGRWANQHGDVSFYDIPITWAGRLKFRYRAARRWAKQRIPASLRAPAAAAARHVA